MVHIRAMAKNDIAAVSRLLGQSWRRTYSPIMGEDTVARLSDEKHAPEKLAAELADDDKMSFVAERTDGSIAGYAMAAMDGNGDVTLNRLHVEPAEFGMGLAVDLLHAVLAAHAGIPSIALEVIEGNDRAIAFYRKHGFEVVERRPAAHGVGGHASLIMRRLLPMA
ncbi:GNAT family N-acetyltransferase [Mesorhizobium sp. M1C.F.Ca.ET.193.01.1.1]|uniref:GNAT family N-acetyltransferase n=2 Tax=Mesorhizobium TaxID=68287 RepID=UPI000FD1EC06|nr:MULTISPECIES: N-acetyltransferase [unclassified Mesorhizobium]TGS97315.1 GNAT family N-acetyltransferase [bacterium M00.F.Ca.ET.177.01.1.1]TGQ52485.1 GNAT family N-acetyltransferase [Mesorhizobium sp. M1C.F.Ca.ET.210.01.1.1]TGQ69108.1 GNAT family N-acetyltransferase [Mesorhizobium sp. M1C.F.Ca.ET.212.01.1.1]TGR05123.1 GNAT family N-acetyltransferase [Mesorhizobium sp. M1C.F.Ca.ET.204.01.1.1]TGR25728.1 GNAT family N-acetyltransferase [Mesorhizobium sp. M1C.F.Ca.ET.196.01.1.1]